MNLQRHAYDTGGEKTMDFFIGFVGWFVINGILSGLSYGLLLALTAAFSTADFETANTVQSIFGLVTGCLSLLINIGALIYFGFTRYWIALGILGAFATALLIVICIAVIIGGICFAALYSYSNP